MLRHLLTTFSLRSKTSGPSAGNGASAATIRRVVVIGVRVSGSSDFPASTGHWTEVVRLRAVCASFGSTTLSSTSTPESAGVPVGTSCVRVVAAAPQVVERTASPSSASPGSLR